jgi:hypothetical protein
LGTNEKGSEIMSDILKIPVIGDYIRNIGTLVKIETIPPKPVEPEVDYIFEDIEARCQLRFNGEIIKNLSDFNDFYGLGTGVKYAIKEMKAYAIQHKITKDSDLEVVVIKITRQYRARPTKRFEYWDKKFVDFAPLDNYQSTRGLPEPIETLVWSSKNETS